MNGSSVKTWELSLLLALCISLCWGVYECGRQTALAEKIIRFHVIAADDSPLQQERKMQVRDAVLQLLQPITDSAENPEQAARMILADRQDILSAARAAAGGEPVELILGTESYPTRHAPNCALPAGEYMSLRIVIGSGRGKNWWGVIYPGLTPLWNGDGEHLSQGQLRLISEPEEYELSFRILEILQALRQWLGPNRA